MVQIILIMVLGFYLLCESIAAASLMDGGDKLGRVTKYLLSGSVGLWLMMQPRQADIWHITMAVSISLFILPKMLQRWQQYKGEHHA